MMCNHQATISVIWSAPTLIPENKGSIQEEIGMDTEACKDASTAFNTNNPLKWLREQKDLIDDKNDTLQRAADWISVKTSKTKLEESGRKFSTEKF